MEKDKAIKKERDSWNMEKDQDLEKMRSAAQESIVKLEKQHAEAIEQLKLEIEKTAILKDACASEKHQIEVQKAVQESSMMAKLEAAKKAQAEAEAKVKRNEEMKAEWEAKVKADMKTEMEKEMKAKVYGEMKAKVEADLKEAEIKAKAAADIERQAGVET